MKNRATIGIVSNKEENHKTISKLVLLKLKHKLVDTLSTILSQLLISIVVSIFSQLIKIKALECLSGFCYPNKSKDRLK